VIHSFFVPQFRLKQDAVPGTMIDVWFQATKTGNYELVCAEFCGLAHYRMRGYLTIEEPEKFEAWLAQSKQEAEKKEAEDEW
jgi:cytochrome c oxidase subunit 2